MADLVTKRGRVFYRLGEPLYLSSLPRDEFRSYLGDRFRSTGFLVHESGLDRLLDAVDEVPLAAQRLAQECWERCRAGDARQLDEVAVDAALDAALWQENPTFTRAWTSLTQAQKVALRAVVVERGRAMFFHGVAERARVSVATLQRALRSLERARWVRKEDAVSPANYRVDDPLFAAWIGWARGKPTPPG